VLVEPASVVGASGRSAGWRSARRRTRDDARLRRIALATALACVAAGGVLASEYKPEPYQPGKDVVWVPSSEALVNRMLDMVKLTPQDYLVDLGSGDGITVIIAAQRGARAHGIEYNPDLVALSKRNAERAGVAARATFVQGDIFESDFSAATVVALFLLPELNLRLRPTLLAMKPGTRIVSNTFDMGDWQADESVTRTPDCESFCTAYRWTVPARAQGVWRLGEGELSLDQSFQRLEGVLRTGGQSQTLGDARLDGAQIRFTVGGDRYLGELRGDRMTGKVNDARSWEAVRVRPGNEDGKPHAGSIAGRGSLDRGPTRTPADR
jgi:SAM-dependent methyltransferase